MKSFLLASATTILILAATGILRAAEPTAPNNSRSYNQPYEPALGGAYRNPDAYVPYYPGYAPYWQTAPCGYPYFNPPPYYLYPPVYMRGNLPYRPHPVRHFK